MLADERHALLFGAGEERLEEAQAALQEAYASSTPEEAARCFDAIGSTLALVPLETAALMPWLGPNCWQIAYDNEPWLVMRRAYEGCPK